MRRSKRATLVSRRDVIVSKPDRTGIARRRVNEKRPGDAARP
jgi:hypothetical protein